MGEGDIPRKGGKALQRFFVLAADGADPRLLRQFLEDGTCPHLRRLAARGFLCPLETTLPALSPVAWATFLTGCNPARHGIVDFFAREPGQYRLAFGLYTVTGTDPPRYASRLLVPGLPALLAQAGLRSYFLWLPGTFPPEPTLGGTLAGLGVPDVLGSLGLSALFTTDPHGGRAAKVQDRRQVIPLVPGGEGLFQAPLLGPERPVPPLWVMVEGDSLRLRLGGSPQDGALGEAEATLSLGEWTPWLRFPVARGCRAEEGMARFRWLDPTPLALYRTPVQYPPDAAPFPLSAPEGFAAEVATWIGPYATLGQACDPNGLQTDLLDDETFLQHAWATWEQRAQALVHLAARDDWSLAVGHLFPLDVLPHLFWADGGEPGEAMRAAYAWVDTVVARLQRALAPEVTFLMVSDHGMCPLRRRVALNRWLRERGYLQVREGSHGPSIDWGRTAAASLGHGGIFLNVEGREPLGTVPRARYEALRREIQEALLAWRDPETGQRVVAGAWPREALYRGGALERIPDLVVALQLGYGLDRRDMLGEVVLNRPPIAPRQGRWAAGHEGPYRPQDVPGLLLAAGPAVQAGGPGTKPHLMDLAPTLLSALGVPVPAHMEGRVLSRAFPPAR
ncbi:MAG: alkaline phosphatase family protein [Anaerolineae bacterium]